MSIFRQFATLAVFVFIFTSSVCSQSSGCNYIVTRTYTKEKGGASQNKIDYYDGLGRLEESILENVTPSKCDLVTYQDYDTSGRESSQWLPCSVKGNDSKYIPFSELKEKMLAMYISII